MSGGRFFQMKSSESLTSCSAMRSECPSRVWLQPTDHGKQMAWHLGYPLSQTLFTSVYVEKILMPPPHTIQDANFIRSADPTSPIPATLVILRAYCLGMLKACGHVNDRIKNEVYYEVCDHHPEIWTT